MKPKDLKRPYCWEERRPLIQQRLLFVPDYYHQHHTFDFPKWENPLLFGNSNPVHMEYCSGNGHWVVEKAMENPESNWVAVEKRFDRARKIWSKIKNHNISNLFIVCGEALTFTQFYIPERTINNIYINFPDPWPKEKHAKKRLMQTSFIDLLSRICDTVTFVTDDRPYLDWTIHLFSSHPSFSPAFSDPFYQTDCPDYGFSYFDNLWREKGRSIFYFKTFNQESLCLSSKQ